jgi:hypothetical protein
MRWLWGAAAVAAAAVALAPAASSAQREGILFATVGPGPLIGFQLANEEAVRRIRPGRYYIVVRDRSIIRNFHLEGPGLNKKTPVKSVHAYQWHVRLRKGTYHYWSDPQSNKLRGKFRVG